MAFANLDHLQGKIDVGEPALAGLEMEPAIAFLRNLTLHPRAHVFHISGYCRLPRSIDKIVDEGLNPRGERRRRRKRTAARPCQALPDLGAAREIPPKHLD